VQNFSNYNDSSSEPCQILQRSLFAVFDAILGGIVTSHTHRSIVMSQLRSGTVDKIAGIFTKRIWPP